MNQQDKYEKLKSEYRDFKKQAVIENWRSESEKAEETAKLASSTERLLLEFCLANGGDLEELKVFFRSVDNEATWVLGSPG